MQSFLKFLGFIFLVLIVLSFLDRPSKEDVKKLIRYSVEKAYFQGQKDALNGIVNIGKTKESDKYNKWKENNSEFYSKDSLYDPSKNDEEQINELFKKSK